MNNKNNTAKSNTAKNKFRKFLSTGQNTGRKLVLALCKVKPHEEKVLYIDGKKVIAKSLYKK